MNEPMMDPLMVIRKSTRGRLGNGRKRSARCKAMLAPNVTDDPSTFGVLSGAGVLDRRDKGVANDVKAASSTKERRRPLVNKRPPPGYVESMMRLSQEMETYATKPELLISPCRLQTDARKRTMNRLVKDGSSEGNADATTSGSAEIIWKKNTSVLLRPGSSALAGIVPDGLAPTSPSRAPSPTYTLASNNLMTALKEEIRQNLSQEAKPPIHEYKQLGYSVSSVKSLALTDTGSVSSKTRLSTSSSFLGSVGSNAPKYYPIGSLGKKTYTSRRSKQHLVPPVTPVKRQIVFGGGNRRPGVTAHGYRPSKRQLASENRSSVKPISWGMGQVPGGIRSDIYQPIDDFKEYDYDGTAAISNFLMSSKQPFSSTMRIQHNKPPHERPKSSPTRLSSPDNNGLGDPVVALNFSSGPNAVRLPRRGML